MASKNFDAFILILLFCILTYTHKYNYDTIKSFKRFQIASSLFVQ